MANADRIIELLHEAKAQPAGAERERFLAQVCGDDAALKEQIVSLLQADEDEGESDFLKNTMLLPSRARVTEKPGDRIGRYKLLEQIGEGGCGVVYMAEQEEPVRRRVALKVIKLGMDTEQIIARFEAERQALALMDHPNIAKVLDAGATETGRPFFVMEVVRGIKITDYCDKNNLSTRERLELFIQVCQAVQHAHQKGVIHRDIKPSNILVTSRDGVPVPKVIDFGIAKATTDQPLTDKTLFTAFAQFMGTPAYMSPEQAEMSELGIDTRSDIYSLGVLLYELLTARTPFDAKELLGAGLDAMRRTIREEEPARPSTRLSTLIEGELSAVARHRHTDAPKLIHLLRGDLDWIVMKSLEKDRARRYETANDLVADINRHLNDEAVVARPPSSLYRFQKSVQRNKLAFGAVTAVALALVIGLGIATWMFFQQRAAFQRASAAEREQARLRQMAELEAIKSEQVASFLKNMLQAVGPAVARGRDTTMLKEILDRTAESLGEDLNQPAVEAELRTTIGEVYRALGDYGKAEKMHRQALGLRIKLLGKENLQVAESLHNLAGVLADRGNIQTESFYRQALASRKKLLGNDHPDVAASLNGLAHVLWKLGRRAEAEAMNRQALEIQRKALGDDNPDVAAAFQNLGSVLWGNGNSSEAEQMFRKALAIRKRVLEGAHPDIAASLSSLGGVLETEGKLAPAQSFLEEAIAMRKKLVGNEHPLVADSLERLGWLLERLGKLDEAESAFRDGLAIQRKFFGDGHKKTGDTLNNLVGLLIRQKKYEEIEHLFEELLTPAIEGQSPDPAFLRERAYFWARRGRWKEGAADATKAVELDPPNHLHYHALSPLLVANGDIDAYRRHCQQIISRFSRSPSAFVCDRMAKDCVILPASGADLNVVNAMAERAVTLGKSNSFLPMFECTKALVEYRMENFAAAVEWSKKVLSKQAHPSDRSRDVQAYMVLAMAQHALQHGVDARTALAKGMEIERTELPKLEEATSKQGARAG